MLALPDGALALGLGTALALAASAIVLGPLMRDEEPQMPRAPRRPAPGDATAAGQATAVDALREIEFDRATGKLSDFDYAELKATYTRQALGELRAKDAADASVSTDASISTRVAIDDDVERVIQRHRAAARGSVCPVDGPRPEPDAVFCSACGRYLAARCPHCAAECADPEQRFCGSCGGALAATSTANAPAA